MSVSSRHFTYMYIYTPPHHPQKQSQQEIHAKSLPAFVCHYYNHYFAHTAGGRMIGKKMAAMLLDGHELHFYQVGRGEGRGVEERRCGRFPSVAIAGHCMCVMRVMQGREFFHSFIYASTPPPACRDP